MLYRLYLLDERGRIRAAETFSAQSDNEAMKIASKVWNACDDSFQQYELWCGSDRITRARYRAQTGQQKERTAGDITSEYQEHLLDLEERLQRSFVCMPASRKLLAATTELRKRLYPHTSAS
jgi:hypothetical protein